MTHSVLPATVQALRQYVQHQLVPVCQSPEQVCAEAWLLLEYALKQPKTLLLAHPDQYVSADTLNMIQQMMAQRLMKRVPIQYLLEQGWFHGHRFRVSPAVLIPRPETELLVEQALDCLKRNPDHQHVVDLGTGSGCIAIALAKACQQQQRPIKIAAIDVSPDALAIAQENAVMLEAPNITFQLNDGLSHLPEQSVDVLLSNPPYIPPEEALTLRPEVLDHEPHLALFANDNGLAMYHHLAIQGQRILTPQGHVIVELGDNPDGVQQVFEAAGYLDIQITLDLAGLDRVLCAARQ